MPFTIEWPSWQAQYDSTGLRFECNWSFFILIATLTIVAILTILDLIRVLIRERRKYRHLLHVHNANLPAPELFLRHAAPPPKNDHEQSPDSGDEACIRQQIIRGLTTEIRSLRSDAQRTRPEEPAVPERRTAQHPQEHFREGGRPGQDVAQSTVKDGHESAQSKAQEFERLLAEYEQMLKQFNESH